MHYLCRMIQRKLERKLKELSKKFPVISLTGPRQSGKTTLVRHVFSGHEYVSLEELDTRLFAQSDPRGFLKDHPKGMILDEVQRVPELFSYIQSIVDRSGKTGSFILTGSQNFLLLERISQSLAGRVAILKLLPLSIEELEAGGLGIPEYETAILNGFYPRLYDKKIPPVDFFPNYIQTYLERDVRLVKNITDLNSFTRFLKLCAGRAGQLVNFSALGQEAGISHATASSWISLMEASYIIFLLNPHHRNFNKRIVKSPKLYFYDTGLACSLLGITSTKQIETHYLRGPLFENLVIADLFKNYANIGIESPLFFWRDKTGHEIDLLIESGENLRPVEIRSARTVSQEFFKDLNYYNNLSEKNNKPSVVVYGGGKEQKWNNITVRPWNHVKHL